MRLVDVKGGVYVLKADDGTLLGTFGSRRDAVRAMARVAKGEPPCIGCGPVAKAGERAGHKFRGNQYTGGKPGMQAPKPPPYAKRARGGASQPPLTPTDVQDRKGKAVPAGAGDKARPPRTSDTDATGIVGRKVGVKDGDKAKMPQRDKHGKIIRTEAEQAEHDAVVATRKVKVNMALFGKEPVLPENATPEQIREARRIRNAIVKGVEAEVDSVAAPLVVAELASWLGEQKKKHDEDPTYEVPNFDICKMTVPGSNAFCSGNLDIDRQAMPQLGGKVKAGSEAEAIAKKQAEARGETFDPAKTEVDLSDEFSSWLGEHGMKVVEAEVPVASLKATQRNMKGEQVVGMMAAIQHGEEKGAPADAAKVSEGLRSGSIFVSADGHIVDGHHRYAALAALDYLDDGKAGNTTMRVKRIVSADPKKPDPHIADLIFAITTWTESMGVLPKSAKATKVKKVLMEISKRADRIRRALGLGLPASVAVEVAKVGDRPGHKFRGNQYTGGRPEGGGRYSVRSRHPEVGFGRTRTVHDVLHPSGQKLGTVITVEHHNDRNGDRVNKPTEHHAFKGATGGESTRINDRSKPYGSLGEAADAVHAATAGRKRKSTGVVGAAVPSTGHPLDGFTSHPKDPTYHVRTLGPADNPTHDQAILDDRDNTVVMATHAVHGEVPTDDNVKRFVTRYATKRKTGVNAIAEARKWLDMKASEATGVVGAMMGNSTDASTPGARNRRPTDQTVQIVTANTLDAVNKAGAAADKAGQAVLDAISRHGGGAASPAQSIAGKRIIRKAYERLAAAHQQIRDSVATAYRVARSSDPNEPLQPGQQRLFVTSPYEDYASEERRVVLVGSVDDQRVETWNNGAMRPGLSTKPMYLVKPATGGSRETYPYRVKLTGRGRKSQTPTLDGGDRVYPYTAQRHTGWVYEKDIIGTVLRVMPRPDHATYDDNSPHEAAWDALRAGGYIDDNGKWRD